MKTTFYELCITGCSDGACIFQDNSHRMHTNGGCGCNRSQHKVLWALNMQAKEIDRLRAENEAMRTALKVIDTWARFDAEPRPGYSVAALHPQHVIELCNKALATPSEDK